MQQILTSTGESLRCTLTCGASRSKSGHSSESGAATRAPPAILPRLRGHDRLPARRRAVAEPKGNLAQSHDGRVWICLMARGGQVPFGSPDPADRAWSPEYLPWRSSTAGRFFQSGRDGSPITGVADHRRHSYPDFFRCDSSQAIHLVPGRIMPRRPVGTIAHPAALEDLRVVGKGSGKQPSHRESSGSPAAAKAGTDPVVLEKRREKPVAPAY